MTPAEPRASGWTSHTTDPQRGGKLKATMMLAVAFTCTVERTEERCLSWSGACPQASPRGLQSIFSGLGRPIQVFQPASCSLPGPRVGPVALVETPCISEQGCSASVRASPHSQSSPLREGHKASIVSASVSNSLSFFGKDIHLGQKGCTDNTSRAP